ncbi:UDP-N-acetylglucosamine--N-acetylmuramyl-(pentapeptide) pyrophosphoryl-undecaprenol N-acetylglucosamine transferase 2 [Brevibacillus reuszeri]|uniref:UDP-N-acetylglucosamine--N-acetylmuramyl-(pentapeptide) pyrophosphoryl-undecaprenol N-acetylglucosamine transferase n=1 Tax=Brevibacillus reuszeri TaxID=54915 RepID=A0A0K9YR81_9BACL|nr:undecaprenyldiphospho-muramoylpentapeptide beta-N-acetylglucosaminyltransferase [Brevibacillus reuszeri]KNB71233.1 UDP-diphospho-muramoylpentapeptide beta-N- acetylglucosaminyltransferase [Brevibacillus reuszeri]MED1857670.1 undecaprenyldiphospho-muramoylpentapeptide beta-N-acetylglucosaminyltransferase [Brevibacillus reuszeri]GED66497.1 UDP-N-acetylglucosamine--N-acetylmuramyl-(pentapeptide) pyrophosphoryl-undecaprenol N-acetylglucosamine transferase 2 [Brevibacillus reuszeri]
MKKRIAFTGGGSAGHVTVNLALIPHFIRAGWEVVYIGSLTGIERELVSGLTGVQYVGISSGKLRRYFDWKNITDPLRVTKGVWQAYRFLRKWKPQVIFSKGGFVSVPVVLGGWLNRQPVVIHESDLTPGLANRLATPFASKICVTFPETIAHLPEEKGVHVGAVVREDLKQGNRDQGFTFCGFTKKKPVLLVMGGSLGARRINEAVRSNLPKLLETYQIVHICGKGQVDEQSKLAGYRQFEYVQDELADLIAMADLVISRAGSNAIFEFLAMQKPMLLIPLSKAASRGDQIVNARSFEKQGFCHVLEEEDLTNDAFTQAITSLRENCTAIATRMQQANEQDALRHVIAVLQEIAH